MKIVLNQILYEQKSDRVVFLKKDPHQSDINIKVDYQILFLLKKK